MPKLISAEINFEKPRVILRYSDNTERIINKGTLTAACIEDAGLALNQADVEKKAADIINHMKAAIDQTPAPDDEKEKRKKGLDTSESIKKAMEMARSRLVATTAEVMAESKYSEMFSDLEAAVNNIGG